MESEPSSEARLRHQLDVQSRQINRVLSHHRVPASVTGGTVRPNAVSFDLQTQVAAGLERIRGLKNDLMSALGVRDVALTHDEGQWRLKVSRPDDAPVPLLKLVGTLQGLPSRTAVLGLADGGQPVLLRLADKRTGHILVTGDVGAGKTSLLRTIGVSLALANRQSQLQLQVMDPKAPAAAAKHSAATPLLPLGYLPHMLSDPALELHSCLNLIHFLALEMEYRRRERVLHPLIIVLIDHVVAFLEEAPPPAIREFRQLIQYGAQAGVHLVMASDSPGSPLLDSTIKASLTMRIIGRLGDKAAARRIAGVPLDQAALLYGEGDFLAVTGEEVTYFQSAYIGDYDLHLVLSELVGQTRPRLLAKAYNARPRISKPQSGRQATTSFSVSDSGVDIRDDDGVPE